MNGATALPCASTSSAPINSRKTTIGASHHFFLNFRKSHTIRTLDVNAIGVAPLSVRFIRPAHGAVRIDRYPVGWLATVEPEPERVATKQPPDEADRRDHQREGRCQDDAVRDEAERKCQTHPGAFHRPEPARPGE